MGRTSVCSKRTKILKSKVKKSSVSAMKSRKILPRPCVKLLKSRFFYFYPKMTMKKNDTNLHKHTKRHILTPQTSPTNLTVEKMKKKRYTSASSVCTVCFTKYPKSKDK